MVLGLYYLTKGKPGAKGEGRVFANIEEVLLALEMGEVETLTPIRLRYTGELIDLTTAYDDQDIIHTEPVQVERAFLQYHGGPRHSERSQGSARPGMPYINGLLKKKGIGALVNYWLSAFRPRTTVKMLDEVKEFGFKYATRAGLSIGIDDMVIPDSKKTLVKDAEKQGVAVQQQYLDGAITNGERYNKVIEIWSAITEKVADEMFGQMQKPRQGRRNQSDLRHG
jgi:DNA-directed RNA polymerase subunit beta'